MGYEKVPFEVALDKAGVGIYSYSTTLLAGLAVISYSCVAYGNSIIVPASACELETTLAQQGAMIAGPFIAGVMGSLVWGYLGDTQGRRKMLLLALTCSSIVNALASLSVNWIMLMTMQFCATLLVSGMYPLSMSLLSESVPLAKRNVLVLIVATIMIMSQGVMAGLAIPIIPLRFSYHISFLGIHWNSWRTLVLSYSLPCIITVAGAYFLQESPKFVFVKGDEARALNILRTIHRVNNKSGEEYDVTGLTLETTQTSEKSSIRQQVVPLFKPPLLKNTLIMTTLFVMLQLLAALIVFLPKISNQFIKVLQTGEATNLTLCGIIQSKLELPPDPNAVPCSLNVTALSMVLMACAMQSTANLILSMVVNSTGRRNAALAIITVCGTSGILVNLVPNAIGSAVLFGGFSMAIILPGLYTAISVSLFPTHLRSLAVALTMTGGRLTGFFLIQISNYMLEHQCTLGIYLFAGIFTCFGVYNYVYTGLTGLVIISNVCITFANTIVVPASACELDTSSSQQGILMASPIIGGIMGSPVLSYLADTRGRRVTLLVSLIIGAVLNAVASISVNWIMLLIMQFIAAVVVSAQYSISMTLLSESVPMGKRNVVVLLTASLFLMSLGIMSVLAIPIIPLSFSRYLPLLDIYWNSWRTLMVVYSIPSLLSALWLYFMMESPKFLLSKGDDQGSLEILEKIHGINKPGQKFEVQGLLMESESTHKMSAKEQVLQLVKPPHLKNMLIMTTLFILMQTSGSFKMWLPTILNDLVQVVQGGESSGLSLCAIIRSDLNTVPDPQTTPCALNEIALLIVFVVAVLQSSINGLLSFAVKKAGRRNTAMTVTAVMGACGILVGLIPNTVVSVVFFIIFVMGVLIMGLYTAMCVFLFPTSIRAMALAVSMAGGRLANFGFIQLVNYLLVTNCELGFYLFASLYTLSAVVSLLLPNDLKLKPVVN